MTLAEVCGLCFLVLLCGRPSSLGCKTRLGLLSVYIRVGVGVGVDDCPRWSTLTTTQSEQVVTIALFLVLTFRPLITCIECVLRSETENTVC